MTWVSDDAIDRLSRPEPVPAIAFGRYEILEELGRGGMGVVHRARDLELGREVALKILSPEQVAGQAPERMRREARVIAQLEHPGIVPIHDSGVLPDGRIFYAMKLVRGFCLDDWADATQALNDRLRVFLRVCETVAFPHARGVVHRDLKPANIMVGAFGEVLIMDWGVARVLSQEDDSHGESIEVLVSSPDRVVTGRGTVIGTPGFMSPEQERGDPSAVDSRSDVFTLGAVFSSLCESRPDDDGIRSGRALRALKSIRHKAMESDPANRYASAQEMHDDIARFLDGLSPMAHRETLAERAARWFARHRTAVAVVGAYLVMRVMLFLWLGR